MDLSIVSQDGDVAVLKIRGRVTQRQLSNSPDALADLLGPDVYVRKVLLDMRDAEFLDSSGISWLLISHKRFREKGGRLVLFAVPPMVMNVLKILRMQLVFDLAGTHEEALQKAQGAQA
jgi:anti-anti-sigma factor